MDRGWISPIWAHRLVFVGVATLLMFFALLPIHSAAAGGLPGPDLLLCMVFAWTMRRPEYLPVWLLAVILLIGDFVQMRPPGLWTALVILAAEVIRSRIALTRELSFPVEWLFVAALMLGVFLAYRLVFVLVFLPQPEFGYAVIQILWSIITYPFVVAVSRYGLDLRKPATGEVDAYGRRL
jgi:rod shape-determining protein MreD